MTRADGWTAGSSQKRFMLYIGWRPVRWDGTVNRRPLPP